MGISAILDTQVLATSGADGDVLTQQADGTYLAETPSAGGSPGGSTGEIQYNDAGAFGGTVALAYAASGTHFTVTAQAATDVPVVVKGASSQTANLQQWQNSAGSVLSHVSASGSVFVGDASFRSNASYYWQIYSTYGKDIALEGSGGIVSYRNFSAPIVYANSSGASCRDGMTALIGRSGLTPTAYAATAFHATLYAQRGGNYNSSVFNGSRSVILQTYNGGNAVSGDNNGGTGGGVIAVVGVGGTATGSGVDGVDGDFKVQTYTGATDIFAIDQDSTAGNTRMLLWDVDSAALVRVSVGADDSGGAGFKVLRIPN